MNVPLGGFVVLLAVMVAPGVLGRADLVGKGRLLTRPLWRYPPFQPIRLGSYVRTAHVRGAQMLLLAALTLAVVFSTRSPYAVLLYDFGGAALYIDDLLTGDDDRWNGLRRRVRRAVARRPRLRGRTPVPSPA